MTPQLLGSMTDVLHRRIGMANRMATLLENGGTLRLWGGWSLTLPPAHHVMNDDGSWSAWGNDWTVDVHIIEAGGDHDGNAVRAEDMLGQNASVNANGDGWVGTLQYLEDDDGQKVYRLTANLAAPNSLMSCWISFLAPSQRTFAENVVSKVVYDARRLSGVTSNSVGGQLL